MSEINESSEFKGAFIEEAEEQLQFFEQGILDLEKNGDSSAVIQKLFRVAHTLKASSGAMGFEKMNHLAHEMENVLDKIRNSQIKVKKSIIDILFQCLDNLNTLKEDFKTDENNIKTDISVSLNKLKELLAKDTGIKEEIVSTEKIIPLFSLDGGQKEQLQDAIKEGYSIFVCEVKISANSQMKPIRANLIKNYLNELGEIVNIHPDPLNDETEVDNCVYSYLLISNFKADEIEQQSLEQLMDIDSVKVYPYTIEEIPEIIVEKVIEQRSSIKSEEGTEDKKNSNKFTTMRIDVDRIEKMMDLVGELVIEQTRISQTGNVLYGRYSSDDSVHDFIGIANRTTTIISELQESIMKVRMLPIQQVFGRFTRMIRDIAESLGKEVNLITDGGDTELDKTIIEDISDPLVHLIRNALDHGIEDPQTRKKTGKSPQGTLRMAAYNQENHVVLEIEDDGAGIDTEKLKQAAIKNQLVDATELEAMSEQALINLIFRSGLSTAKAVSDVSGRGVGMDVVGSQITKLNGIIDVETTKGVGTKYTIKLPLKQHLTLAIQTGLLVKIGVETYAIPMNNVVEIVRKSEAEIESIEGQTTAVIRKKVLPIIWLHDYFNIPKNDERKNLFIVVLGLAEKRLGLVVDELVGNQEIVVKPLGSYIGKVDGFSGATILGDRSIACILDISGIAKIVDNKKGSNGKKYTQSKELTIH